MQNQAPGPDYQMGAMSPQPTDQQQQQQQGVQQHGAPVQYPQPTADQQHGAIQQHQQPLPPGYAQEKPMDPASAPQHVFPPQGQMYPAQPQAYGTPLVSLNQQPAPVACPRCSHRGMTEVEYESGGFTHLMALGLCCCICLGCIPYMIASLKDVQHKCAGCKAPLATYHRSGRTEVHMGQTAA